MTNEERQIVVKSATIDLINAAIPNYINLRNVNIEFSSGDRPHILITAFHPSGKYCRSAMIHFFIDGDAEKDFEKSVAKAKELLKDASLTTDQIASLDAII